VILRLGVASGKVLGVEIDTAFFDGNHAPEVGVEGTFSTSDEDVKSGKVEWDTILEKQECGPSQRQAWILPSLTDKAYTHVRLLMYPDGGIARFRLFGKALPVFPQDVNETFDLAATVNGGLAISCSDQHFGRIANLLLPGRGVDMGDGWETKRTRGEHVDWAIIKLGAKGIVEKLVIDTAHFRGNFPQKVQVFAIDSEGSTGGDEPKFDDQKWIEILSPQKTGPDKEHVYEGELLKEVKDKTYSHVKLVMIPDGGIKRIRVIGRRSA
jgi:allantoicase